MVNYQMEKSTFFETFVSDKNKSIIDTFLADLSSLNTQTDDCFNHKKTGFIFRKLREKNYPIVNSTFTYNTLCLKLKNNSFDIIIEEQNISEGGYCEKIKYPEVYINQISYQKRLYQKRSLSHIGTFKFSEHFDPKKEKKFYGFEMNLDISTTIETAYENLYYSSSTKEIFKSSKFPLDDNIIHFIIDNMDKDDETIKDFVSLNYDLMSFETVELIKDSLNFFINHEKKLSINKELKT